MLALKKKQEKETNSSISINLQKKADVTYPYRKRPKPLLEQVVNQQVSSPKPGRIEKRLEFSTFPFITSLDRSK